MTASRPFRFRKEISTVARRSLVKLVESIAVVPDLHLLMLFGEWVIALPPAEYAAVTALLQLQVQQARQAQGEGESCLLPRSISRDLLASACGLSETRLQEHLSRGVARLAPHGFALAHVFRGSQRGYLLVFAPDPSLSKPERFASNSS